MIEKKIKILFVALGITLTISFISWSGVSSFADMDKDGVIDAFDNCPNMTNSLQSDFDGDKIGDGCDPDDDNDNVIDEIDAFDTDPTEWADFDKDGTGNNSDPDDDNDNVIDEIDAFDTDPTEWADFDFDGIGTNRDVDDDNDGILDNNDPTPIPISEKLTQQHMTEIENCISNEGTERLLCYGNFFDSLVDDEVNNENPLKLALALSRTGIIDDCHFISHIIGHAVFDETSNLSQNLIVDGSSCRGGYYHGVMGAFFHDLKNNNEPIPDNYKIICDDLIGESNYIDCIHGLGHGLVNYYPTDLESTLNYCHQMSYFQNAVCVSGSMMQYTDNQLTEFGATTENLSNMCSESELNKLDFQLCSMNIGLSLAFHNDHDLIKSTKYCQMIENEQGKNYCLDGLKKEIVKAENEKFNPLAENIKEKFQPQKVSLNDDYSIIDFRSVSIITDFEYFEETKTMIFFVDQDEYVIIHVPRDLLSDTFVTTINGKIIEDITVKHDKIANNVMISIEPNDIGLIMIAPLPQ